MINNLLQNNKYKTLLLAFIVNILVWYSYCLIGINAPQIGDTFFPSSNLQESLLKVFLLFAIGYIVRPIGGVIFGIMGDKVGRKMALTTSIILISLPTFLLGILPSYKAIGYVSYVGILLIRLLQGIAIGGALISALSFSVEHFNKKNQGFVGGITMAGICIGIFLGSLVNYLIYLAISQEQFNSWGWRIPFLLSITAVPITFYIAKHLDETPEFYFNYSNNLVQKNPLLHILSNYKKHVAISLFLNSAGSVLFYLQVIYIPNYLRLQRSFDPSNIALLMNYSYILMALTCIITGYVSDLWSKKLLGIILMLIFILAFPMIHFFVTGSFNQVIVAHISLSVLAASYISAEQTLQMQIYPSYIRNTGLSLSYNVATTIFGGVTPYIMERILFLNLGAAYLITTCILSLIALFFMSKLNSP